MPRKKVRSSPVDKRTEEVDDDDFFFDDSQSSSGKGPDLYFKSCVVI